MNQKPNYIVITHEDNSMSFIPRECVLYITEWFDENKNDFTTTMMNCRVVLKNNQGIVIGKYNREFFSVVDFFAQSDYTTQKD